jgi:hypothetical protein
MRSFEIAAVGGCMLARDIDEHREIFGSEGEAAVYFRRETLSWTAYGRRYAEQITANFA